MSFRLLVVRHGIAGTRERWAQTGEPDAQRPLTRDGRRRMRRGARGLAALLRRPDLIATSPLARALQTAELVARAFESEAPERTDVLAPAGSRQALLAWLRERRGLGLVAIVGHEPHLSTSVSWLLHGRAQPVLALRKGGACLLEFDESIAAGKGRLAWLLTPAQLRRLGA